MSISMRERELRQHSSEGRLSMMYHDFLETTIDGMEGDSDVAVGSLLLGTLQDMVAARNSEKPKGAPSDPVPKRLDPYMVAGLSMRRYHFCKVSMTGSDRKDGLMLAVYIQDGSRAGLYSTDIRDMRSIFRGFSENLRERDIPDVMGAIMDDDEHAPVRMVCRDPWLLAVGNGIFDDRKKVLMPFTPDLVFLTKIRVDYNPYARNVSIQNPDGSMWDFDSWMLSLNSDPENVRLLMDVIGMAIRPNQPWNKMVLLYSEQGNNGKGTFCRLVRNVLGDGNCEDLQMADFESPFMLSNIMNVQAIIGDENGVGRYLDDIALLKACVTGDPVIVNRKFKDPVRMIFRGLIIQCINGLPKVRDQSDSWMRRLVFVLMDRCFTGQENPRIKDEYLGRRDVLEYVLKISLEKNLTPETLRIPVSSEQIKSEYKQYNDPVYDFWMCFEGQFVWDLLPYSFLYDLYKKWFVKNHPSGKPVSHRQFVFAIRSASQTSGGWTGDSKLVRPGSKMDEPERLVVDWELEDWMDVSYKGDDWTKAVSIKRQNTYRGLVRKL